MHSACSKHLALHHSESLPTQCHRQQPPVAWYANTDQPNMPSSPCVCVCVCVCAWWGGTKGTWSSNCSSDFNYVTAMALESYHSAAAYHVDRHCRAVKARPRVARPRAHSFTHSRSHSLSTSANSFSFVRCSLVRRRLSSSFVVVAVCCRSSFVDTSLVFVRRRCCGVAIVVVVACLLTYIPANLPLCIALFKLSFAMCCGQCPAFEPCGSALFHVGSGWESLQRSDLRRAVCLVSWCALASSTLG